jgi:hypothetical protein
VLADQAQIDATQAQVETSKVSLDQASEQPLRRHRSQARRVARPGRLPEPQQQQLIVAQYAFEKDKLALARTIGLPLAQKFRNWPTRRPYSAFDQPDVQAAIKQALDNRKDRKASAERPRPRGQRKAATYDRLPTVKADADYGDIGVQSAPFARHRGRDRDDHHSHLQRSAVPRRSQVAQSALDQQKDKQSDLDAQIEADVRDALLDIASSQQQVEVSTPMSSCPKKFCPKRSSATRPASATIWPSPTRSRPWPRPTANTSTASTSTTWPSSIWPVPWVWRRTTKNIWEVSERGGRNSSPRRAAGTETAAEAPKKSRRGIIFIVLAVIDRRGRHFTGARPSPKTPTTRRSTAI